METITVNQRDYCLPDRPVVVVCVDGCAGEYLALGFAHGELPHLAKLAASGHYGQARGALPSFTNVNNCAMVTGTPPSQTGIGGNYILDPDTGEEVMTNSSRFLRNDTILAAASDAGRKVAMVTAKDKLRKLLGEGTTLSVSSEQPPQWVVDGVGEPPPIYSIEVNEWVIDAGRYILSQEHYDLVYLTTTDYAMHTYAPEESESARHIELLDAAIGRLMDSLPDVQLWVTADHGMSSKGRMIHLPGELASRGIQAQAVPIIKDLYTVHHSNLGGCIYLYLQESDQEKALEVLRGIDGIDEALPREEAAKKCHLMSGRIGDLMVLGAPDVVFGDPQEVTMPPTLRSHGSLYEERVPIIGYGSGFDGFEFKENKDLGRFVFERVLASSPVR